jgi:hypothetical protein
MSIDGAAMGQIFNVYCDESCYQQNDHHRVMTLGALWCPLERVRSVTERLREIKKKHLIDPYSEIKWTRVSPAKLGLYRDLIEYFFDDSDLHFRGVIIPNKRLLRHEGRNQTHDEWHHKMWFVLLSCVLSPKDEYRVYLDIKDTHSAEKARKLHEVLCNSQYDFSRQIIRRLEIVRSEQAELMQLADLVLGSISYANRALDSSTAKLNLVALVQARSGYSLTRTTLQRESKVNLLRWRATEAVE